MSLCNALEEKLTKKEAEAERLVGAVVNGVTNVKSQNQEREEVIKDILNKHKKSLKKLS